MDNYIVISFVGEGSFGRVFKAKHKHTNAFVALKVIRKKGRSSKDLKNLRQECDIQRQLNHPNIIRMIDSFETDSELVVVTEYAEKELHSILAKEGCLSEEQVKNITWDLVSALYYLHSHRVLHRDLKPQNVLLDSTGRAKLCDFGLARIMTNATHILTSIKGTPLYMAPELIDEKPYDHQADLWSLGCIVYELMAGQPPFCTMSIWQLVRMIRHKPVQWPSFISADARSFLQGLLHKDPIKRMSWQQILEHPFVSGHILILPEDKQSDSPFTKPLTCSQQEAKFLQTEKISKNTKLMVEMDLFDYNCDGYCDRAETPKTKETDSGVKEKISEADILFSVHKLTSGCNGDTTIIVLYECNKSMIADSKIDLLLKAVESATIKNKKTELDENNMTKTSKRQFLTDIEDTVDIKIPLLNLKSDLKLKTQKAKQKFHLLSKRLHSNIRVPDKMKRKKLRKSMPETWQKNIIIKNNLQKHKFRSIPDCRCECKNNISDNAARNIFNKFINLENYTEQNMYLQDCLLEVSPQRHRCRNVSGKPKYRRVFKYFVDTCDKTIEMCQQAFINIHGIKKDRLHCKVQQPEKDIQGGRGRHNNHRAYNQEILTKARYFLENLHTKYNWKVFPNKQVKMLDSSLSVAELHCMYVINNPHGFISYEKFRQIFNTKFNFSFGPSSIEAVVNAADVGLEPTRGK